MVAVADLVRLAIDPAAGEGCGHDRGSDDPDVDPAVPSQPDEQGQGSGLAEIVTIHDDGIGFTDVRVALSATGLGVHGPQIPARQRRQPVQVIGYRPTPDSRVVVCSPSSASRSGGVGAASLVHGMLGAG